jgi:hypothetical protein
LSTRSPGRLYALARLAGGRCIDGFKKIAGECIECLYFNLVVLVQSLLFNFGMALFLLHKAMKPVVSRVELPLIWNKVGLLLTSPLCPHWPLTTDR